MTSVSGKVHPSKPTPHPKYLMDFFSFKSSKVCNTGFQHIPPCLVGLHRHSQVKSFPPWFLLVGLFEGDSFISHLLEQMTARGSFSASFFQSMAKVWMFSSVSRNLSAGLPLLFAGGRTQPATASSWANTWHQPQLLLPLPSTVRKTVSLASFHRGLGALIRAWWAVCPWSSSWDNQSIKSAVFSQSRSPALSRFESCLFSS